MTKPSLRSIASLFFRIGNTTFGSGSTAVILLSREMNERGWLERWQTDLYYALARVVPGTNVLAFVTSAAYAVRGWIGAVTALGALSVPAAFVVVFLTLAYQKWHDDRVGGAFINTAMCAIVGIIIAAGCTMAWPRFVPGNRIRLLVLMVGAAVASRWLGPLTIVFLAGVLGYFWGEAE